MNNPQVWVVTDLNEYGTIGVYSTREKAYDAAYKYWGGEQETEYLVEDATDIVLVTVDE